MRVLSTLQHPRLRNEPDLEVVTVEAPGRARLVLDAVRAAPGYDAVVLDGSVGVRGLYADLVGAGVLSRRSDRPLLIADATWKRGSWWLDRLACRLGVRLVDAPSIRYCVLSSEEVRSFPRIWGIDPARVSFTPWPYTLRPDELVPLAEEDGSVFAGGDSLREYGPLLQAAGGLDAPVRIATRRPLPRPLPANVHAGGVPHDRFVRLLHAASIVVVPLAPGLERSAGQQTYLNAMALGKAVVVTEAPGVRDHVEDGVTGLVVPNDAEALRGALDALVAPERAAEVLAMRERARRTALGRFSPEAYSSSVVAVVRRALAAVAA